MGDDIDREEPAFDRFEEPETLDTETQTDSKEEAKPATESVTLADLWGKTPAEERLKLLEADPDFKRTATKSVRNAHVRTVAEQLAEEKTGAQIKELQDTVVQLRGQIALVNSQRDEEELGLLPEPEQRAVKAERRATSLEAELNTFRQTLAGLHAQDQRELMIDWAASPDEGYGFEDDDVEELRKVGDDPVKLTSEIMKRGAMKVKQVETKYASALDELKAELGALTRRISGETTFAETAPQSPGSKEADFNTIEDRYRRDPDTYRAQYTEARRKAGLHTY